MRFVLGEVMPAGEKLRRLESFGGRCPCFLPSFRRTQTVTDVGSGKGRSKGRRRRAHTQVLQNQSGGGEGS